MTVCGSTSWCHCKRMTGRCLPCSIQRGNRSDGVYLLIAYLLTFQGRPVLLCAILLEKPTYCSSLISHSGQLIIINRFISDAPDAPTSLEIKELGSRQIQLLWKLPFSGNAAISQCTVQWRSDNGLWHDSATVGGDERQATIRGLKPTTKYWFKVRCQNMFGVSEFSNEYEIVTSEEREYKKKRIGAFVHKKEKL